MALLIINVSRVEIVPVKKLSSGRMAVSVRPCVLFVHPSAQVTKGSIGGCRWPDSDLLLIWCRALCFLPSAFHRCLPAALFTVPAIVPLPLHYRFFFFTELVG